MGGCRLFRLALGFYIASLYCAVSAALMILLYCGPVKELRDNGSVKFSLNKSELILTLTASLAWGFFNAGYVVYLSFSPLVLMSSGHSAIAASSIVSAASWLMIFSVRFVVSFRIKLNGQTLLFISVWAPVH